MHITVQPKDPARIVVLASGAGTLLQALLDAANSATYPAHVVAVGSDRSHAGALDRAVQANVPRFVLPMANYPDRAEWDLALSDAVAEYQPDLVVLAGFMRLVGPAFLARFGGRTLNTHPALLPSFPGAHAVADALAYGVQVTGSSLIFVGPGVDDGPILAQVAVPVRPGDDVDVLHERIKQYERTMLVEEVARLVRSGWAIDDRKVSVP